MTEIKCARCGTIFQRKFSLKRHYEREKICKPIELDIPICVLKEVIDEPNDNVLMLVLQGIDMELYYNYLSNQLNKIVQKKKLRGGSDLEKLCKKSSDFSKIVQKTGSDENTPDVAPESTVHQKLSCKYCGKHFSAINNRSRHELHRCKLRTFAIETDSVELDRDELIETVINDESIIKEITDRITNINTINSNNTTINSNNTINNANNYTVNIYQNVFGQENFDYIKNNKKIEAHLEKLADTNTRRFFIELFRLAYFSPKHPENKTFNIDNAKSLYIKILKELPDKWVYASKSETFYKKITQILSWITDETTIVTEGTSTEKKIEQIFIEQQPAITEIKKEFEMMEVLYYKNKKLERERAIANKLNKATALDKQETDLI